MADFFGFRHGIRNLKVEKPLKLQNSMIIGIPKEIKNNENRVALTPSGAQELT